MATASADACIRLMEDELSCYICYNLLRDPKDLDCQHIFCLECLQDWVKKEPTIECPECRHITIVPPGGLVNLKTNLRLKAMVEKYAGHIDDQKEAPLCPNHKGERQHFFCVTCGVTVCHNCLVLLHERPHHEIKELKVVTKQRKETMKTKIECVQQELQKTESAEKELHELERKLQAATTKAKIDIRTRADELVAEVRSQEKKLKDEVDGVEKKQVKAFTDEQHRIQERVTRLTNVRSAAQNSFDAAADHMYMKSYGSLVTKMDSLCVAEQQLPSVTVGEVELTFKPGSGRVRPLFGKVEQRVSTADMAIKQPVIQSEKQRNRKCKLTLMTEFGEFKSAQGVAVTQSGILAVVEGNKQVFLYHEAQGKYKRQLSLSSSAIDPKRNANQPYDVAATSQGQFLVTDKVGGIVKMYSAGGRHVKMQSTGVGNLITTTPDDMILICSDISTGITVHQLDGKLIRTHQMKCRGIDMIASNGKQIAFTPRFSDKLCVIDFVTGTMVWSVDVRGPGGVCYDTASNTILVAHCKLSGYGRTVISQYCSTTGLLISSQDTGLTWAFAMTITHYRRLIVADRKTVKVYKIQAI